MNFLKYCQKRIVQNKINKGFPIGNFPYEIERIKLEVEELEKEVILNNSDSIQEEAADVIIFVLGLIEQYDSNIDMTKAVLAKMEKNEKRKITKISELEFEKKEGQ